MLLQLTKRRNRSAKRWVVFEKCVDAYTAVQASPKAITTQNAPRMMHMILPTNLGIGMFPYLYRNVFARPAALKKNAARPSMISIIQNLLSTEVCF